MISNRRRLGALAAAQFGSFAIVAAPGVFGIGRPVNRELPDSQRPRHSSAAVSARQVDAVWIAGFILAAEIGGLAACGLTHESLLASLLIPLLVAAVAVVVLRTGALDRVQEPASRHGGSPADGQRAAAATAHVNPDSVSAGHSVGEPAPTAAYGIRDSQPYAWSWPLSGPEGDQMASAPTVAEPAPVMPGVVTLLQDPARTAPPPAADRLASGTLQDAIRNNWWERPGLTPMAPARPPASGAPPAPKRFNPVRTPVVFVEGSLGAMAGTLLAVVGIVLTIFHWKRKRLAQGGGNSRRRRSFRERINGALSLRDMLYGRLNRAVWNF